jgi:Domain of unknown function (DUF4331)
MSHHFDNPNARDDPRLNVNDFYLFSSRPGRTVMAMTVNPDAGLSAPETLRDEGLYAFRFDLNGDDVEEVTFKFRFSEPSHGSGDEHTHVQSYEVLKGSGPEAVSGAAGEIVAKGNTGEIVKGARDVLAFVGLAPDLFAGDGVAINKFKAAFYEHNRFSPAEFQNHQNIFEKRNVTAIVLEVPTELIGRGKVRSWATSSLYGHAPEMQICRWGWPLFTHIFLLPDVKLSEAFNRGVPSNDISVFGAHVEDVAKRMTTLAMSAGDPAEYAKQLAAKLLPNVLPYELDTSAAFDFAAVNGRALSDDVMDVILTQTTNTALADGVAPDVRRIRADFPYFGAPFSHAEQAGVPPAIAKKASGSAPM